MELRQIKQFSRLVSTNRNPNITEHLGVPRWDNNLGYFTYVTLSTNSKTVEGMVAKGDDSAAGDYIWKLDSSKNPAWRKEQYLVSMQKNPVGNNALFTMNDGTILSLPLGSLAWSSDTLESQVVSSVFARTGDVVAQIGDYTAAQVTNAFDKSVDTLGDITAGDGSYHFSTAYRDFIDILIANNIDQITNIGSGLVVTDAERILWNAASVGIEETIRDTVALFIQNGTYITWTHDDLGNTLTGDVNFAAINSDLITEGSTNLYFTEDRARAIQTVTLPSAGSVAARIAAAVEGIDYPTGWILTAGVSPVDIVIQHGLSRRVASVTIFAVDGTEEQQLFDTAAYNGIKTTDVNTLLIQSLATITKEIKIYILFV